MAASWSFKSIAIYNKEERVEKSVTPKNSLNFEALNRNKKKNSSIFSYQWVRFHGAGWGLLVRPLLKGLTRAAGADAGGRKVEQLCLVLLGGRPRQGAPHPLHWVFPYRLLTVDLKRHNAPIAEKSESNISS